LIKDAAGEYHLQKGSPAIDAAKGNYTSITTDMDGQARKSPLDTGADEVSNAPGNARILKPSDVGHAAGVSK
jgi:poly(beta-D-mannuronate) lyase